MDEFTERHLRTYCDYAAFEDEREGFFTWAKEQVNDDPTHDWDWSNLLRVYRRMVEA